MRRFVASGRDGAVWKSGLRNLVSTQIEYPIVYVKMPIQIGTQIMKLLGRHSY